MFGDVSLSELQTFSTYIDSRLESINRFLNGFTQQPNEINVDTPLVYPFLDSDDDFDDGEVLNELEEYGNAGQLCRQRAINSFDWDDLAFQYGFVSCTSVNKDLRADDCDGFFLFGWILVSTGSWFLGGVVSGLVLPRMSVSLDTMTRLSSSPSSSPQLCHPNTSSSLPLHHPSTSSSPPLNHPTTSSSQPFYTPTTTSSPSCYHPTMSNSPPWYPPTMSEPNCDLQPDLLDL
ncbi:hypothetical protein Tco_1132982 [Tanacetum coccineum]|uniref:Uncharacterized protein n=1 Tax=Tanacetum coccineum TaxID=301880 RepID=A0ABQ5JDF6_9ASTR